VAVPNGLPIYSWSQTGTLLAGYFTDDKYHVESMATDYAGNFETTYSTITFLIDTTPPATAITSPANGSAYSSVQSLTNITGTSSDPNLFPSGVQTVQLSVTKLSGGTTHFFNGANFNATTEYMLPAVSTAAWSYWAPGLNAGNLTNGATYRIHAYATDIAGNVDVVTATSTFVFDTDTPISTVSFPTNNLSFENPTDIDGIASDVGPAGLQKVQISLRLDNPPTSQTAGAEDYYLDPSSWSVVLNSSFTSKTEKWIDASGTLNWSFDTSGIYIS